ncbi:MAG: nicotinate phosphoribosyltransferase [Leptospiraceae bacterium]|nr:nicotinate phosphoribosyltransferase [Leptospiraceae bacterium]MDW7975066.1 nicotinate phosphoribosyltransferase [Leptospiraceae bacterium]
MINYFESVISFSGIYTDLYQLSMAQVLFYENLHQKQVCFDYFFRHLPYEGGYAIFAGLEDVLDILETLRFREDDIEYLASIGFRKEFLAYLKDFRFQGSIYSFDEGEVVFPYETILQVEGNFAELQIIETLLLNILNFESLIATKASRIRLVAGDRILSDFGLRRAQGTGGYFATRAIMIGGFDSTSNVQAGKDFKIPVVGTMAHSFIQAFEDELTAFRTFAKYNPQNCVLLIDTYDTLNSGLRNAIIVAKELEQQGYQLKGIRIDSGDLAYLAKECRRILDQEKLDYVKIIVSNQLDEWIIKSLLEQNAPIDVFGVGTKLIVGKPDAALDGVYKLTVFDGKPKIKVSDSLSKITIPGKKQIYRLLDQNQVWIGDVVCLREENPSEIEEMRHPFEPLKKMSIKEYQKQSLMKKVMENGKRVNPKREIKEISNSVKAKLKSLPEEYKRFINPHIYKVGLSSKLYQLREELIRKYKNS